jgi:hypothetical protein
MTAGSFYRPVDPTVCQGDLFDRVPHLFLRPPLLALRRVTLAGGREAFGFYEYPPPTEQSPGAAQGKQLPGGPFRFNTPEGEDATAWCQVTRAVVLNHDCDIENEPDHRLVALVRPLAPVRDPAHQDIIRRNLNFNYFYLPAGEGLAEGYVDFRRITSLSPAFLAAATRLVSLTPEAVQALQFQFFRFLTRRDLSSER